jgi:hypothetical protein
VTRFNWQSIETSPRDGSVFVHLQVGCFAGLGVGRQPIACTADVTEIRHAQVGRRPADLSGYWQSADGRNAQSIRVGGGYWLSPDAYRAALVGLGSWRTAPADRPVMFVRPLELPDGASLDHEIYEADSAWWSADGWRGARSFGDVIHPRYLDGHSIGARPYLWCEVADFLPRTVVEWDTEFRSKMR